MDEQDKKKQAKVRGKDFQLALIVYAESRCELRAEQK